MELLKNSVLMMKVMQGDCFWKNLVYAATLGENKVCYNCRSIPQTRSNLTYANWSARMVKIQNS